MSRRPSDKPPDNPAKEPVATSVPKPDCARTEIFPFGLSAEQYIKVTREMLVVARAVCRHSGVSPGDIVQQTWVTALLKPESERPSIQNQKGLIAWLCELTKCNAMTNRNRERRRAKREVASTENIAEMVAVPSSVGAVEARAMLDRAFMALEPEDQALLHALYAEGKTTDEIATEQGRPWSTVDNHHRRLRDLLYAAIQAGIAALILVPKRAHAFVAHVTQGARQMLVQATQFGGAMSVTVVCGGILPTGSSLMTEPSTPVGLTAFGIPQTNLAQVAGLPPSFAPEVEPEEPKPLDAETNQCSDVDMKSTKFASLLQKKLVPLALAAAPTLTQVACTSTECQTSPRQPADESDDDAAYDRYKADRAYEVSCDQERARGNKCMSREEWDDSVRKMVRPR